MNLGELQKQIGDLPHSADRAAAHDRIADLVSRLDEAARPGLNPGRTVALPAADGYALYVVLRVGRATCTLLHVPIHDGWTHAAVDERGICRTSLVREVVECRDRLDAALRERTHDAEAFYAALHPGSHVHFLSSSGPIRCEVTHGTFLHDGQAREGICLRPLVFVGTVKQMVDGRCTGDVWQHDLYRVDPTGRVEYGYHASNVRRGELFRCALHDLYESGRASPRVEDPRGKPALPLEPPKPTAKEAEQQRLWAAAKEAVVHLSPAGQPLPDARTRLNAAKACIEAALATA